MKFSTWLNRDFESSSGLTQEFASFYREIQKFIKQSLNKDFKVAMHLELAMGRLGK